VLSVSLHAPSPLDLRPTGPGEARKLEVPGAAVHETGGFLPGGREVFASVRDAAGKRSTWLLDLAGGAPRRLPLPEGHILMTDTFSPDGRHFVASCSDYESCIYDTETGESTPVPGAKERWSAVAWDARGRIYFRAMGDRWGGPEELWRVDPRTGRSQRVAALAPRDGSGALGVLGVLVAADGESWAYNVMRRLSDLYVATDLH
jgi:hypothetical protein